MRPRAVADLSRDDAAYLAGLIDGEGTIALSRRHARENRQLVITISTTERILADWVLQTTGVGKITSKTPTAAHHAPGLTYAIANRQALALLRQVAPFLKSYKANRARLVLDRYLELTPRNGKYDLATRIARGEFERQFAAISIRKLKPRLTAHQESGQEVTDRPVQDHEIRIFHLPLPGKCDVPTKVRSAVIVRTR